jgi:hypothetical protein
MLEIFNAMVHPLELSQGPGTERAATMAALHALLLALVAPVARGWTASPLAPRRLSFRLRAEPQLPGAADMREISDEEKTEGIPNYMIRTSGTIVRLAEGSATAVAEDGLLFDADREVSIVTSDVIEMVQQQGGSAEKIDYLGENMLVEGMLFDDFMAKDVFEVAPAGAADDDVVTLEIVEARSSLTLDLGQLGQDEDKKRSIESITSIAPGFSGWTARVVAAGRVRAGFTIAKRDPSPA